MATYNGACFIREQLRSLLDQTVLPLELVVCDDGSSDATCDIVRDFARTRRSPYTCMRIRSGWFLPTTSSRRPRSVRVTRSRSATKTMCGCRRRFHVWQSNSQRLKCSASCTVALSSTPPCGRRLPRQRHQEGLARDAARGRPLVRGSRVRNGVFAKHLELRRETPSPALSLAGADDVSRRVGALHQPRMRHDELSQRGARPSPTASCEQQWPPGSAPRYDGVGSDCERAHARAKGHREVRDPSRTCRSPCFVPRRSGGAVHGTLAYANG